MKEKKTPEETSEDKFNKKPTIQNSYEQCISSYTCVSCIFCEI